MALERRLPGWAAGLTLRVQTPRPSAHARVAPKARAAYLELERKEGGREEVRQGTLGNEGVVAMLVISMATIPCHGLRCAVPRCAELRPTALRHATLNCDALYCVVDQVAMGAQNLTELI